MNKGHLAWFVCHILGGNWSLQLKGKDFPNLSKLNEVACTEKVQTSFSKWSVANIEQFSIDCAK